MINAEALPVAGWESAYSVTNVGTVIAQRRIRARKNGQIVEYPEKAIKPYRKNGYWAVTLKDQGKRKNEYVHRLVCRAFNGPPKDGQEVRHLDGNPLNNEPCNLKWGTRTQNMRDKAKHGTARTFDNAYNAKLSSADFSRMVRQFENGLKPCQIAREYAVTEWRVRNLHKEWENGRGAN